MLKIGDIVRIVQSESDTLVSAFTDEVGIIVDSDLGKFRNQDSFMVLTRNKLVVFGENFLEVISE